MKLRPYLAPLALALFVVPVRADAPPDQYRPFVHSDLEVHDQQTGLIWLRAVGGPTAFDGALGTCPTTGGVTYRIPTMKELLTLVDEEPHAEYENGALVMKAIDGNAFPSTPADLFWSSSTDATSALRGWAVDFGTGVASLHDKTEMHAVRCVRP